MMTQTQVTVKVVLPEMVCRNCKRFYIALQDGRGRCQVKRGEVVSRNGMCDRFSPVKVDVKMIETAINDRKCSQCVFSKQDLTTSNGLYVCDIYYEIILNQQKAVLCPKFIEAKRAADYIKRLNEYASSLESRVAELDAKHRWIPVSERLPEEFTPVLTIGKDELPITAAVDRGHWYSSFEYSLNVTHWMPLPEPPEEYQNDPA